MTNTNQSEKDRVGSSTRPMTGTYSRIKIPRSFILFLVLLCCSCTVSRNSREIIDFTFGWKFCLGDTLAASATNFPDSTWRTLNLPHDWSIEADFARENPASPGGGALPGGIGWYRKTFTLDESCKGKCVYIDFDGVYRNSEVWINGTSVGKRPYGYSSFRYDLTPYIKIEGKNVIAVRVDNSQQPNSRWYSGSGIYRNVRLVLTYPIHVDLWGTYVTTPKVNTETARVVIQTTVKNTTKSAQTVEVIQSMVDQKGREVGQVEGKLHVPAGSLAKIAQDFTVDKPKLWTIEEPYMYKVITKLYVDDQQMDEYETPAGIRTFRFDVAKGFILNGKSVKINGVCNHHDLGALGAAVNKRAIERQLEILKAMGCNGIRCSHNPPSPELLDLCDEMGFIVMDEAFDMWGKSKTKFDYASDFPKWYERDLTDLLLRDRNHPSVFMWSIGNEVGEQWVDSGTEGVDLQQANVLLNLKKNIRPEDLKSGKAALYALLTRRLAEIVKSVDPTRPVTAACNETGESNPLFQSGALDIIGFNYHHNEFADVQKRYPGKPFIVTESVSALQTRGFYTNPSTTINIWPERWDKPFSNLLQQCSAYDNCHVPWGTTHEETWKIIKRYPHIAGQYIWTGFDYLGEPTPYWWPSRSSFFGIIDLAGFPKDSYYMYQSEWTDKDVLHIFPHWNWKPGQTVDIWAYYNHADEVELYLNGKSLGKKSKIGDDLHVMWSVPFTPGTLKAVSRKDGKEVLTQELKTAGTPVSVRLTPDRRKIRADGKDLCFVTVELLDKDGIAVPTANDDAIFSIRGEGSIVGTDNGNANDHLSLKTPERRLFNGKCLAIVQSTKISGMITLKVLVGGLPPAELEIKTKE
jgi:beta-galactosidase